MNSEVTEGSALSPSAQECDLSTAYGASGHSSSAGQDLSANVPGGLSLRTNVSWTFVGNAIYAGCQWGMLVALAKLGSPDTVGQFALGLAISSPVIMFACLELRLVQATDAQNEYAFGDYLGLRLITSTLALLVIAGIALASGYRWEVMAVIMATGLDKALESVSDVFYGLFQQCDRMDRVAQSMMIHGPLSLVALSLGVYLAGSVLGGVMGLVVARVLVLLAYDMPNVRMMLELTSRSGTVPGKANTKVLINPRWERQTLVRLARLALPLGFVAMLSSLQSSIPRYAVERLLGENELGIFAAVSYFYRAGSIAVKALGQSASSRLSRYYAAGNGPAFRTLLLKLAGIGVLLGVGGVLVAWAGGRQILTLFYQPEYARQDVFLGVMAAAGLTYVASLLVLGLTAARYLRVQTFLYLVTAGILVLSCGLLIPSSGLRGAATALVIANGVQAMGSLVIVLYAFRALHGQMGGREESLIKYNDVDYSS